MGSKRARIIQTLLPTLALSPKAPRVREELVGRTPPLTEVFSYGWRPTRRLFGHVIKTF